MGIRRKETYDGNGNLLFVQNEEFDDAVELAQRQEAAEREIDSSPALKALVALLATPGPLPANRAAMMAAIRGKVN